MRRVPEPELMEGEAQAAAYAAADFKEPHDMFIEALAERVPESACMGRVVDLGCGPADITIRFARRFPGNLLDAVDGSAAMLQHAAAALKKKGLEKRITLHCQVLPALSLPHPDYDLIISNSLLHHLHDAAALWTSLGSLARPDTHIFIMDLMRPTTEIVTERLVKHYAGNEPEILQRDFYNSLRAAFTPAEINKQLHAHGLGHLLIEILSDRHLCISGQYKTH